MLQHIYARSGILYINTKIENKRVRLSTGLKDNALSVQFILQNFKLFLKDKTRALQKFYELNHHQALNASIKTFESQKNEFAHIIAYILKEKQTLKPKTQQNNQGIARDIMSFLELKNIRALKDFQRQHSTEFVIYLQAKSNASVTIKRKARFFKNLFTYAIELDLLDKNPFFMPKLTQSEQELENEECKPFDLNQMQALIKESSGELKSYLTIAFFTGLRTGELLGLKRDDLDLGEKKAHIKRTLLNDDKTTNSPKTRSSYRTIDLLPIVIKELQSIASKENLNTKGFLFQSSRKKLRSEFYALQERLGIEPRRRLYDTRHSFASVMLSQGEEPMWISRVMLGHSTLTQTFQTYAKYLPKNVSERATFLNGMEF